MKTIVEPKESIDKLWGKQKVQEDAVYRLMQYVLRVDHDGKVLLHNVVTGQLVVLDVAEAAALEKLPTVYNSVMEQLVTEYYLVPEDYYEHQQVVKMRDILSMLSEAQSRHGIIHYVILPTTTCNAHCFYCYENGLKAETMTSQTAYDVVKFIKKYCQGNRVFIRWFGGEPTLAMPLIDQICEDLRANSIDFVSRMTTNGYLMDKETIEKMKVNWHLEQVMISLDGSETNYNETKAFAGVQDNPYQRVLLNVGYMLDQGIYVSLRMNFDERNYWDFSNLLEDVERNFGKNPLLQVRPHQINPIVKRTDKNSQRDFEQWCNEKIVELNELSRRKGLLRKEYPLPCLKYEKCLAASDDAVVIMPDGSLVSCPDLLDSEQVKGDIWQGIVDKEKTLSWKQFGDYERCRNCLYFPRCTVVANCEGGGSCILLNEYNKQYSDAAVALLHSVS